MPPVADLAARQAASDAAAPANRVVVSGIGLVSAAGLGTCETWARLTASPPVPARFQSPPPADVAFHAYRVPPYTLQTLGVERQRLAWLDEPERRDARDLRHMLAATALALTDARLPLRCDTFEPGVAVVAANESPGFEELSQTLFALGAGRPAESPRELYEALAPRFFELNTFLPPHYLARVFGLHGPSLFVNSACASGLSAIDTAAQIVRTGRSDVAIAVAADYPLSAAKFWWFDQQHLYAADGVIRPFDRRQSGTVFGEGAAALILEREECARQRGGRIYAEYAGAGFAQDGWKITVPSAAAGRAEAAVRGALAEAGVDADDVDLAVPHGVGTGAADQYEACVLHRVFGHRRAWPAVTALKPLVGHSLGASALIESAILLLAMSAGRVPPTLGYELPPARHALPLATSWEERRIDVAVKVTCAFAGYYGAAVFRRTV